MLIAALGVPLTKLALLFGPAAVSAGLGFGAAAVRVPLVTLGLMQYFSPVVQFLVEQRVPLDAKNKYGETALWASEEASMEEVVVDSLEMAIMAMEH